MKQQGEVVYAVKRFPSPESGHAKPWIVITSLRWYRGHALEVRDREFAEDEPPAKVVKLRLVLDEGVRRPAGR